MSLAALTEGRRRKKQRSCSVLSFERACCVGPVSMPQGDSMASASALRHWPARSQPTFLSTPLLPFPPSQVSVPGHAGVGKGGDARGAVGSRPPLPLTTSPREPPSTTRPVSACRSKYSDCEAHSGIGFDVALWTQANFWGVVFLGACQSNSSLMNTNYCTDLLHEIGAEAISIQAALQDEIFLLGTDSRK